MSDDPTTMLNASSTASVSSTTGVGSEGGEDDDCGGVMDEEYNRTWEGFVYWCEGVLMVPVGVVGLLGNVLAIIVLSSDEIRRYPFHHLLLALSVFDLAFIVCSVPVHVIPVLDLPWLNWAANTRVFGLLYQFGLYPLTTVTYCGGVYMTAAITLERFLAVRSPLRYRASLAESTPLSRALRFILPAVAAAFLLNLPKFLEIEVSFQNGTAEYKASSLRMDPTYIFWYTHSFIIHPFLTTTILPILVLCIMNAFIYRGIMRARRAQGGGVGGAGGAASAHNHGHGEVNLQVVLVIICLVFVLTHVPRLVLAIEVFVRAAAISRCMGAGRNFVPPLTLVCMEAVSNLLILINASSNFIIYCMASTHFKVFIHRKFHKEVRHSVIAAESAVLVNNSGGGGGHSLVNFQRQVSLEGRLLAGNGGTMTTAAGREISAAPPLPSLSSAVNGVGARRKSAFAGTNNSGSKRVKGAGKMVRLKIKLPCSEGGGCDDDGGGYDSEPPFDIVALGRLEEAVGLLPGSAAAAAANAAAAAADNNNSAKFRRRSRGAESNGGEGEEAEELELTVMTPAAGSSRSASGDASAFRQDPSSSAVALEPSPSAPASENKSTTASQV